MPSDYGAITKENIRRLGEDTDQYKPLINLYANPTHFIYELLQNSDDYGATTVSFKLSSNTLVMEHSGVPFSEKNVRAISDIGRSTSATDFTKTGCFGLGFKSVFAFTATPQVISGDESFEIQKLSRLKALLRPVGLSPSVTRIVLPFNHNEQHPDYVDRERSPEESFREIGQKLRDIGLRTLLFTKNILEVKWSIDSEKGHYLKEECDGQVYLTNGDSEESYLVFSKDAEWEGQPLSPVSIAFRMKHGRIIKTSNRSLFVLFETALETHLDFLVNGAFRTTPSRENIKYADDLNVYLVQRLSILLGECLDCVKQQGLLDAGFLQCLPINITNAGSSLYPDWQPAYPEKWAFRPLYEQAHDCLTNGEFLPADAEGQYTNAPNALLARGEELRTLFPNSVLKHIWEASKVWLSGDITTDKTPELRNYLIHCLDIREVDPPTILGNLTKTIFELQSLEWLVLVYEYVSKERTRINAIKSKEIPCIPLETGEWVYANETNVVFPQPKVNQDSSGINFLKAELLEILAEREEVVRSLLEDMGVHSLGEADEVLSLLSTYYDFEIIPKITVTEHLDHIRSFMSYWESEPHKAKNLFSKKEVFCVDAYLGVDLSEREFQPFDEVNSFRLASMCYIDQPLKITFLSDVLDSESDDAKRILSHCYVGLGERFISFAKDVGVLCGLAPDKCEASENPKIKRQGGWGVVKHNCDYRLPKFVEEIIKLSPCDGIFDKKFNVAHLIWEMMCSLTPEHFKARLQPNANGATYSETDALLIQQLSENAWLQHIHKGWMRPCDLTEETLYTGSSEENLVPIFDVSEVNNGWLQLVQFGQSEVKQKAAKTLGLDYSDCQLIEKVKQEDPDFFDKLREQFLPIESVDVAIIDFSEQLKESVNKPGKIEIDEQYLNGDSGEIKKPLGREKKLSDEIEGDKEGEAKPKPPRLPRLTKSIECKDPQTRQYLLEWYGGKCQMCEKTWAKRNGKPYFEAAYLVEVKKGRWLDRPGNAICLCADHFAQWKHASKEDVYDLSEWISKQKLQKEGGTTSLEIEFKLLGERVIIKYTEGHFLELRTMVKMSKYEKASNGEP